MDHRDDQGTRPDLFPPPQPGPPDWPGPPPAAAPRPGGRGFAAVAWFFIALLVVAMILLRSALPEEPSDGEDPIGDLLMRIEGRYLVGAAEFMNAFGDPSSAAMLYTQSETFDVGTLGQRQRFVVLAGELAGPEEATGRLDRLQEDIDEEFQRVQRLHQAREELIAFREMLAEAGRDRFEPADLPWPLAEHFDDVPPERLTVDQLDVVEEELDAAIGGAFEVSPERQRVMAILGRLYETDEGDDASEAETTARRLARLSDDDRDLLVEQLGWFGELALAPAAGPDGDARDAVLAPTTRTFLLVIGAAFLGAIAALGGLAGLVWVFVLALLRKLANGVREGFGHHGIYAETFAIWMLIFIVLQVAAGLLGVIAPAATMPALVVAIFLSLGALIWPVIRGIPWTRVRADIGWTTGRASALEPLCGLGCYLMALPILGVGVALTFILLMIQTALAGAQPMFAPAGGPAHPIILELGQGNLLVIIQVLILGAIAAPIVEETMFRGVLYRHLRDASRGWGLTGSVIVSTLINAFVFAVIHPQGWVAIPALMSLAVAFSLAREWRGTVLVPMIMHGVSNGVVLSLVSLVASA